MSPESRVKRLLVLAQEVASPKSRLGALARAEMNARLPLSPEGIELALGHYLEKQVSQDQLRQFMLHADSAARCHLLLSANVCTGAMRALAWALATSPRVFMRASSRDPVLAQLFAAELEEVEVVESLQPLPGDVAHLYGSDETLATVVEGFDSAVRSFCHGSGFGIALVSGDAPGAAEALARDLVVFDGRGCLSPRFVFALNCPDFSQQLHGALKAWDPRVPRAELSQAEQRELGSWIQTMRAIGEVWVGESHAVGVECGAPRLTLAPAHRCLTVVEVANLSELLRLLDPWRNFVTCIGAEPSLAQAVARALGVEALRLAPLGQMQHPPFDGPVDLRLALGRR